MPGANEKGGGVKNEACSDLKDCGAIEPDEDKVEFYFRRRRNYWAGLARLFHWDLRRNRRRNSFKRWLAISPTLRRMK